MVLAMILILEARFYEDIADELAAGAIEALEAEGCAWERRTVPGAFELPAALRMALESGRYEGYVVLGCVIRGETSHYDYVCGEAARGVTELTLTFMAAVGFGLLTVENREQAWERAARNRKNKGAEAVRACLAMQEMGRDFGVLAA